MYVMTSNLSFSCGNGLPYYAKLGGVKVIGQQSAGGKCCVYACTTVDGYPIQISGAKQMQTRERMAEVGYNIENGVPVDIEIENLADCYDIEKVKALINA